MVSGEKRGHAALAALMLGMLALPALAAPPAAAPTALVAPAPLAMQRSEGDVDVRDFAFRDGERPPLLRRHYTALGTPRRDASGKITNAVLLFHATTGTGKTFLVPTLAGNLFELGQPLDAQRYYVVPRF